MQDADKTKEQLIEELAELRMSRRISQDAREYAENIVETVHEPLIVLDAELRVISASRSFYQRFEVTAEESEGELVYDLGNRQWDIPKLRELLEKILPQSTTFNGYEVEHDFETIGQRTMLLNARQIFRESQKTKLILLAIDDISERKQAEAREKKERLQEYEAISQSSFLLLTKLDPSGNYLFANETTVKKLGYSLDELLTMNSLELLHPDDILEVSNKLKEVLTGKATTATAEYRARARDGSYLYFLTTGVLLPGSQETEPSIICMAHDITESKRAQEAIRESTHRLRESQEMAHLGNWFWDVKTGEVKWSDEVRLL